MATRKKSLEALGGTGDLRPNAAKDGFWITSHGSYVLDMRFDKSIDVSTLNTMINNTPGVVEHGIFHGLAHTILIANNGIISEMRA